MKEGLDLLNGASAAALAAIVNSLWQAATVVLVTWVAMKFLPGLNAATRHLVWWGVLGVVALLPVAPSAVQHFRAWQSEPLNAEQFRPLERFSNPPDLTVAPAAYSYSANPLPRQPLAPVEVRTGYWPLLVAGLWLLGLTVQLSRIVWSYSYLRQVKKRSSKAALELKLNFDEWLMQSRVGRDVKLMISDEVASPMAAGFVHPAVILPGRVLEAFSAQELDQVVLHELAHLERRDDWTNLAGQVASAFLMLHPAAAWILRQIEREREIACDDWVVSMTGEARPYAACLARLFEICWTRRRAMLATGMATRASNLGERVEMLLRRDRHFTARASVVPAILCGLVLGGMVMASAQAPHWFAFASDEAPAPPAPPVAPMASSSPRAPGTPRAVRAAYPNPQSPLPALAPEAPTAYRVFDPAAAPSPAPRAALAELPELAMAPITPSPSPAPPSSPGPAPAPPAAPRGMASPPMPPMPPAGAKGSLLAALVAAGYGDLPVDEIIDLKNQGVTADYILGISRAGWGKLATRQITELRNQGVSPEFLARCKDIGVRDLTIREVIELRQQGVKLEEVREIHALGFGPYSTRQCIELHQQGVRAQFFQDLKDTGFARLELREIIEARNNGLRAGDLREARKYGPNLSLRQIIKLKQAGVI
ncbi:M56 family metallopeptidase [Paludibaculum fermentans]|uniref:M56 family metallopeptidase n=1 Tax=Paludibaculum fermentans TaxID=1473598 RepID=UPI003EB89915